MSQYFAFIWSAILTALIMPIFIKLGHRFDWLDHPRDRHQHKKPTAILGGVAVFLVVVIVAVFYGDGLVGGDLLVRHWLGVLVGALVLVIGGLLDDRFKLSPLQQLIFPLLAVIAVVIGGVNIAKITDPSGGTLALSAFNLTFNLFGHLIIFNLISHLFVFLWLLGMIYTTKLLDGLDGLVGSVGLSASLIIFFFTQTSKYYQPDISLASAIVAGALVGFLIYNWHPAKVFLGESGSMLVGFLLGVLSIISGAKVAVALLVMGLPILDTAWTIMRRLFAGQHPFKHADRGHLHYRLEARLGVKKTVVFYGLLSLFFGLSAIFLQSLGKFLALSLLVTLMVVTVVWLSRLDKREKVN